MFLRTFDLQTSIQLWDFILVKGEMFIFILCFVVFGLIDENLTKFNKDTFFEEVKLLIFESYSHIIKRVRNDDNLDLESFVMRTLMFCENN